MPNKTDEEVLNSVRKGIRHLVREYNNVAAGTEQLIKEQLSALPATGGDCNCKVGRLTFNYIDYAKVGELEIVKICTHCGGYDVA